MKQKIVQINALLQALRGYTATLSQAELQKMVLELAYRYAWRLTSAEVKAWTKRLQAANGANNGVAKTENGL